jgi:hypothetical protein
MIVPVGKRVNGTPSVPLLHIRHAVWYVIPCFLAQTLSFIVEVKQYIKLH